MVQLINEHYGGLSASSYRHAWVSHSPVLTTEYVLCIRGLSQSADTWVCDSCFASAPSLNPSIPMSPCHLITAKPNLISSMRNTGNHWRDFRWQKDWELFQHVSIYFLLAYTKWLDSDSDRQGMVILLTYCLIRFLMICVKIFLFFSNLKKNLLKIQLLLTKD